jgi:hypothetical protein
MSNVTFYATSIYPNFKRKKLILPSILIILSNKTTAAVSQINIGIKKPPIS